MTDQNNNDRNTEEKVLMLNRLKQEVEKIDRETFVCNDCQEDFSTKEVEIFTEEAFIIQYEGEKREYKAAHPKKKQRNFRADQDCSQNSQLESPSQDHLVDSTESMESFASMDQPMDQPMDHPMDHPMNRPMDPFD